MGTDLFPTLREGRVSSIRALRLSPSETLRASDKAPQPAGAGQGQGSRCCGVRGAPRPARREGTSRHLSGTTRWSGVGQERGQQKTTSRAEKLSPGMEAASPWHSADRDDRAPSGWRPDSAKWPKDRASLSPGVPRLGWMLPGLPASC